jgi:MFS family permease
LTLSSSGPPIGGALASSYWPALFYINLPLTAIVAAIVSVFLKLKTPEGTYREKLQRMDWLGNLTFIPSITFVKAHRYSSLVAPLCSAKGAM